jgi:hypothetical protein
VRAVNGPGGSLPAGEILESRLRADPIEGSVDLLAAVVQFCLQLLVLLGVVVVREFQRSLLGGEAEELLALLVVGGAFEQHLDEPVDLLLRVHAEESPHGISASSDAFEVPTRTRREPATSRKTQSSDESASASLLRDTGGTLVDLPRRAVARPRRSFEHLRFS